jgi:hypothetical protein
MRMFPTGGQKGAKGGNRYDQKGNGQRGMGTYSPRGEGRPRFGCAEPEPPDDGKRQPCDQDKLGRR